MRTREKARAFCSWEKKHSTLKALCHALVRKYSRWHRLFLGTAKFLSSGMHCLTLVILWLKYFALKFKYLLQTLSVSYTSFPSFLKKAVKFSLTLTRRTIKKGILTLFHIVQCAPETTQVHVIANIIPIHAF